MNVVHIVPDDEATEFDINFYSHDALQTFINAAQSAVAEYTPPTSSDELHAQHSYRRIVATARLGLALPASVQIPFDEDLRPYIAMLIDYSLPCRGLSADCDLRETLGFEFD